MAHLVEKGGLAALKDAPFLNFKVICKDKEWMVHKTYLCGDSEALVLHCTRLKVSSLLLMLEERTDIPQEGEQGRVCFDDDEPEVIERFLSFQYVKDYNDVNVAAPLPGQPTLQQAYGPTGFFGFGFGNTSPDQRNSWRCAGFTSPVVNSMEHMTMTQVIQVLLLNIRMYALADRFNLSSLKKLAVNKLMSKEKYFRYCHLDQLLGTLKAITAPDDVDLLYRVFARCVENYPIMEATPGAVAILETISPFGWSVGVTKAKAVEAVMFNELRLRSSLNDKDDRIRDLEAQLEDKDGRITELDAQLEEEQNNHQSTRERLNKKTQKVNTLQRINASRKPKDHGKTRRDNGGRSGR